MNGFEDSWYGDSSAPTEMSYSGDGSWKDLGTSMSAISFGLAATAILVSMFLVMAILEHLIKPRASLLPSRSSSSRGSAQIGQSRALIHRNHKFHSSVAVGAEYSCDFPVLMPGQPWPTFIAQPAPLPCPREGIQWPPHEPRVSPTLERE